MELDAVGVIVPARNEEANIDRCLDSITFAVRRCCVPVVTLVVLDSCTDSTARRVAAHPEVDTLVSNETCVGAARRAGVLEVLASVACDPARIWLAHTDADSATPPGWLEYMVAAARVGVDLVLGTVIPDLAESELLRAWERRHPVRMGHRNVYGANLGIRGSAYLAAGGFSNVCSGEDVDLAERASALFPRSTLRTAAIPVLTSARRVGRASMGFAHYLEGLDTQREDLVG